MVTNFDSFISLMDAFPDERSCVNYLRAIRWRNFEFCPHCKCNKIYHFSDQKTFKCGECKSRFSVKVGTIFEDTKLPLRKWFMAIWMITNHPKGVASTTLAKELKITQKSAWFIMRRLRYAARTSSFAAPLNDTVERDAAFMGGKEKNMHAIDRKGGTQGSAGKEILLGTLKLDGEYHIAHVHDYKAKTIHDAVEASAAPKSAQSLH